MKLRNLLIVFVLFSLPSFAEPETEDAEIEVELDEDGNPIVKVETAPEWKLVDVEGNEVSSETLKDKAYVLHFWASWNPYCLELQPALDAISIGYVKKGIPTYAISFWENPKTRTSVTPTKNMENRGLMLPVLEKGEKVAKAFGVLGVPTTIFVKQDAEISYRHTDFDPNDPQIRVAYEELADSLD